MVWKPTPSAARIAFELVGEVVDLSDLSDLMEWVDKLDGGSVSKESFSQTTQWYGSEESSEEMM